MTIYEYLGKWYSTFDKQEFTNVTTSLMSIANLNPNIKNVFRAFHECPYDSCKVIMIGQDPYPQKGVATGIAFGNDVQTDGKVGVIKKGEESMAKLSPSLQIIIDASVDEGQYFDPSLTAWCKQGVLLLNSALTVEIGKPSSHSLLWRPFMTKFIYEYSRREPGQIYLLFGTQAQSLKPYIYHENYILEEKHPSYYTRSNTIMPKDIFTTTNKLLYQKYGETIQFGITKFCNE